MSIHLMLYRSMQEQFAKEFNAITGDVRFYDCNKESDQNEFIMVEFAIGRVVTKREENMHDDSDFFASYVTLDGEVKEHCYSSTRFWTYNNSATIDATEQHRTTYDAYINAQLELAERTKQALIANAAKKAKLTIAQYDKLRAAYRDYATFQRVLKLLSSNLRSDFRIKLAVQVREWLDMDSPVYLTPLSMKQLSYV